MTNKDFLPTAIWQRMVQRAVVIKRVRAFFGQRGFVEVETPILSHDTVVDRYIEPIAVNMESVFPGQVTAEFSLPMWLQTSPEFGMKRLLAAGATAIYQITKSFRATEVGRLHNPEFTMLEWYRVGDDLRTGMDLLAALAEHILNRPPTIRLSYQAVFENAIGLNPHTATAMQLESVCKARGVSLSDPTEDGQEKLDRDAWLNLILATLIEQTLGFDAPTIVYDWPASQAALAIVRHENFPLAERFELYVDGMEIANGYHELLDADELMRRNVLNNQLRLADGGNPLPAESRLLAAMQQGIPACAGVALGIDRLVMLATGAASIEEVIAFPIARA